MSIWMVFTVLLLVTVSRFYVPVILLSQRRQYFRRYVYLMNDLLFTPFHKNPWVWCAFIAVPPLLLVGVVLSLCDGFVLGKFVVCVVVLWCSLDCRFDSTKSKESILSDRLYFLFGPIVWFALFGVVGVTTYVIFCELLHTKGVNQKAFRLIEWGMAYLNWIPERLLGISVALVGYFSATFCVWRKGVWQRPSVNLYFLQQCGLSALGGRSSVSEFSDNEMALVLFRVLVLWLMSFGVLIFFHSIFLL